MLGNDKCYKKNKTGKEMRVESASAIVIQREDLSFYYMDDKVTFKQGGEGDGDM